MFERRCVLVDDIGNLAVIDFISRGNNPLEVVTETPVVFAACQRVGLGVVDGNYQDPVVVSIAVAVTVVIAGAFQFVGYQSSFQGSEPVGIPV